MRDAFIRELHQLAEADPRVALLSADIGFAVFDKFRAAFPDRFFNFGIAESNMVGAAAGMALSGKRPFAYTIIPFLTMRAFEQIRVDLCIQKQPVVLVGVGGGVAYGTLGPTHHAIEDVAILRALPNMTVVVPADPSQAEAATRAALDVDGPVYIRLGKNGEPDLVGDREFALGKAVELRGGNDVAIIASGPILSVAIETAEHLAAQGVECRVVNIHTVKPLDEAAVLRAAEETKSMVSLEEHSTIGGVGAAVAEVLAEKGPGKPFKRIGIPDEICSTVGGQEFHWRDHGMTKENIADTLVGALN